MIDFKAEISKIFKKKVCLEHWTADAGHDDYWCPDLEELDKIKQVHALIKKNLKEALDSHYPYVATFAYMVNDPEQKFMSGHERLDEIFS
jgi:hypothetical protein